MYRVKCTPELAEEIAQYIRSGVFDWVAAVAVGMSRQTFRNWMRSDLPEHAYFRMKVEQANAVARAKCEINVHKTNDLAWLLRGPGRDRPDAPGWTTQMAVTGKDGGALEQVVTQAEKKEDYSGFTVEEMRQLRTLRERARAAALQTSASSEVSSQSEVSLKRDNSQLFVKEDNRAPENAPQSSKEDEP